MMSKSYEQSFLELIEEAEKISKVEYDKTCDGFEFVINAMRSLAMENHKLYSKLNKQEELRKMNIINRMLAGELETDCVENLKECGIEPNSPYMLMGLIYFKPSCEDVEITDDIFNDVSEFVKHRIKEEKNAFFTIMEGHFIFTIFLRDTYGTLKLIDEIWKQANDYAFKKYNVKIKFALSEIHTFLKGLAISYKELLFCLKNIDATNQNIVFYNQLSKDPYMLYKETKLANSRFNNRTINIQNPTETSEIITQYIDSHYGDYTLDVTSIANLVKLHPNYLSNLFKKQTGMGILSYITNVRIENAKKLLKTTNLNINLIAQRVGYTNSHTFTRSFKKIEGITPTEYRKNKQRL